MTSTLEIVRAGAGAGKTTDLCHVVAAAVEQGLDPSRILATTFTVKAAAQLKGRVQAELLRSTHGNAADARRNAERLETATIGTVHSVAHQLITRYAIPMGLSPKLNVIDEQASEKTLNDLLGELRQQGWEELHDVASRLSQDGLSRQVLKLLELQRGNRIDNHELQRQLQSGAHRVCELLAPDGPSDNPVSFDRLYGLVEEALQRVESVTNDNTQVTEKTISKLRQLGTKRSETWKTHVTATRLTAGKRSGADAMLDELRTEASRVRTHPELHEDLCLLATQLAQQTIELSTRYQLYKRERGLVDFTDLEVHLLELLENDQLRATLEAEYDLVLVDEFQDTNPLQLAIFERLRDLTPRSRWVGDPKQAIYGFRDTDPDLVRDIWENAPNAQRSSLPKNYRAQQGLVELVDALFTPVFGADASQQSYREAAPRGGERWLLDAGNNTAETTALGCGIAQLHAEGCSFRDMALLARTNEQLSRVAEALDALGIPYLLEGPGLLATREGQLVLAGLRLVADRSDSLAAATLLHLVEDPEVDTPTWFSERLITLRTARGADNDGSAYDPPWEGDPRFQPLEQIDRQTLSPAAVARRVIEAVGAPELVAKWGDVARRNAHLDSLLQHASDYEESALAEGRAATLSGLILYLEELARQNKDVRHAPLGHDAVTLLTYHRAKGLEWPIVILSELDYSREPDVWSPSVSTGRIADTHPLSERSIRQWSWPFGMTDGQYAKRVRGSGLGADALNSPEGQAQSRSEADEALRLLYVGFTRARDKLVLTHRTGKCAWLHRLENIEALLPADAGEGEHSIDGINTTFVLRKLSLELADDCRVPRPAQEIWFRASKVVPTEDFVERYHHPSAASPAEDGSVFDTIILPGESYFPSGAGEAQYAAIGDAVHSYFASLPSLFSASEELKTNVATRCITGFGVSGLLPPDSFVKVGERFREWVAAEYPGATWHTEVPVSAPREGGGQWTGAIDLLLELPNGSVVLVDHKERPYVVTLVTRKQPPTADKCEPTGQS